MNKFAETLQALSRANRALSDLRERIKEAGLEPATRHELLELDIQLNNLTDKLFP